MERIINLFVGSYLILSLGVSNHVYAGSHEDDSSVLDFLTAIMSGAGVSKVLYKCKTPRVLVTCGIEGFDKVENYYAVYIDKDEKYSGAIFVDINTGAPFKNTRCGADTKSSALVKIGRSDLPKHLQDTEITPTGKKALFFRIDVSDGDIKDIDAALEITCEGKRPTNRFCDYKGFRVDCI